MTMFFPFTVYVGLPHLHSSVIARPASTRRISAISAFHRSRYAISMPVLDVPRIDGRVARSRVRVLHSRGLGFSRTIETMSSPESTYRVIAEGDNDVARGL